MPAPHIDSLKVLSKKNGRHRKTPIFCDEVCVIDIFENNERPQISANFTHIIRLDCYGFLNACSNTFFSR